MFFKSFICICLLIISSSLLAKNEELIIKCHEITGTGGRDIFKINKPEFFWYYNFKWHEIAVSKQGVAKDWEIIYKEDSIRLYNKKMEWLREIDLRNMTAYMKFSTGEQYLYECQKI